MPFQSKAQQRFMYAKHPEIAARWEDKYGIPKNLPDKKQGAYVEKIKRIKIKKSR